MSPVANAVAQIVDIPLGQILANPENPRGPVDPQAAQAMAESLQAKGQQVEIRVRALTEAEKTKYPGYEYLLIGGHVRLAGAKLAGLAILRAVVLEGLSEDEEELAAILDNRWEPMSWWRWDLAIERRMKRYTGQTQRKVAAELGLSAAKVNNAWKITRVLTPEARKTLEKSVQALNTENKGFSITEVHLLVLAELGDAEQVERALGAVLDDYLTPDQCKKLVAWVKAGNPVDSFKVGQVQKAPAVVSPEPKTESQVKEDRKAVVDPGDADSGDRASGSMSKPSPLGGEGGVRGASAGHTPLQELYLYLTSDPLRKFLAANLKRALGTLTRRWMVHGILALGLLLLLGRSWIGKLLAAKPLAPAVSQTQPAPTQSQTASDTETSQNQPASPYPAIGHKPMATNGSSRTKAPSEGKVPKRDPGPAAGQAEHIPAWAPEGIPLLKEFGDHFFGRSGAMWSDDLAYFKGLLTADYYPTFQKQFFPSAQQTQMQIKQEYQLYSKGQLPKAVGGEGNTVLYRVQGEVTLQSRASRVPKTLWTKPMALEISLRHLEGLGYRVERVREVEPDKAVESKNSDGVDPLKAVQDVSGGVAKVAGDVEKVDKVGKLLGL